jgi:hypothetical protein
MPKKKVKITLTDYGYPCGDGCCYNYGTIIEVNGERLESEDSDVASILESVLAHLGYSVEVTQKSDFE